MQNLLAAPEVSGWPVNSKKLKSVDSFTMIIKDEPSKYNYMAVEFKPEQSKSLSRPTSAFTQNGIWGYRVPKPQPLDFCQGPIYSFPRDQSNYLELENRPRKNYPGPAEYTLSKNFSAQELKEQLKKRRVKADTDKITKRPFFTEEAIKETKNAPAPGQYQPKVKLFEKVQGSVKMKNQIRKNDKKSYMDDIVKSKSDSIGQLALNPKVIQLQNHIFQMKTDIHVFFQYKEVIQGFYEKRVTGLSWKKPEKQESWKIEKKLGPDGGSYNPGQSVKAIGKQTLNTIISKTNVLNSQAQYVKEKEFVPPMGIYDTAKCYQSISRPTRKRQ